MSAPVVPQRPARSQDTTSSTSRSLQTPTVPPRPIRATERSISRDREASTRSPLNDAGFSSSHLSISQHQPESNLRRPSSVAQLPLIGQEGDEYASLDTAVDAAPIKGTSDGSPSETRNVASDLPLHAPKASASPEVARTRVVPLTRTDTEKASIAGVGKPATEVSENAHPAVSSPSASKFRPPSAASTERPGSAQLDSEHEGIPSFGITVPMYPNAGDVQAPTPGPTSGTFPPGSGYLSDGSRPPAGDGRKRSAHGYHGPPGAYGLHGHGVPGQDRFEKSWYQKHPGELAKEELETHKPASALERPSWAMSSDELNKLVHDSARNTPGFGTNPEMIGTPTEAIGYQASLEYAGRGNPNSAIPQPSRSRHSRPGSQSYAESPLRKTFSAEESKTSDAVDDDSDSRHHIDPPRQRVDKIGPLPVDRPTADLGIYGGNSDSQGGWIHERGTGTPILASDEIMKDRHSEFLQPAVSPAQALSEDDYYSGQESDAGSYRSGRKPRSRPNSRPSSRPTSIHTHSGLSRFTSHEFHDGMGTPLEEIEEYEPLFKDDDKGEPDKLKTVADRLKRPDMEKQRFPSQDIWEDTPTSLQLQTTVDTPEEPRSPESAKSGKGISRGAPTLFEHPEKEQMRRGEVTESEREVVLRNPTKAKPKFNPAVMNDRPGLPQRFPSRDIWEDTPDSLSLTTTVGETNSNGVTSPTSPVDRPAVPGVIGVPKAPARPQHQQAPQATSPTDRKGRSIPERPRPQVPQRPSKKLSTEQPEALAQAPAADTTSTASSTREKPTVPARPGGSSKFASIKAGFMSDLNSRLQLGPQAPPKPQVDEPVEDKTPLEDARKGRARGPARRKPAVSPGAEQSKGTSTGSIGKFSISAPRTVWSIASQGSDDLSVPRAASTSSTTPKPSATPTAAQSHEQPSASPLARNTAGESLLSRAEAPETASGGLAHKASPAMDERALQADEHRQAYGRELERERIGFEGDVPEPQVKTETPVTASSADKPEAIAEPDAQATGAPLSTTESHPKSGIVVPDRAAVGEVPWVSKHALEEDPQGHTPVATIVTQEKQTQAPAQMESVAEDTTAGVEKNEA